MADARSNKLQQLTKLTSYEETVKRAVERAEREDEEDDEEETADEEEKEPKGLMATMGSGLVKLGQKMGGGV